MRIRLFTLLFIITIILPGSAFFRLGVPQVEAALSSGIIDTSFDVGGGGGIGPDDWVKDIAIQSDGKVLMGGKFDNYNAVPTNRLVRLDTIGNIDSSFDIGTGPDGDIESVVLQDDGKILVGGWFSNFNGVGKNGLVRLNSDGSIDSGFNMGTGLGTGRAFDFAEQSDNKIIVGGDFTSYNGVTAARLIRLNSDGTLDSSYDTSTGGYLSIGVQKVSLQTDGKAIIAGNFTSYRGTPTNRISRINTDGSIDLSFSIGTGFNQYVYNTEIQTDGKIIAAGNFTSFDGNSVNRLVRINSDGSYDSSFDIGTGFNNAVYAIKQQSDGKVLVGGFFSTYNGGGVNNLMARLNSDGSLDSSFEVGAVSYNVFDTDTDSNGKIYSGLFRQNTDGSLDDTFNTPEGPNANVIATAVQSDGKIIIAGQFTQYDTTLINRIARVNADGGLDSSFDVGAGVDSSVFALGVQDDGKILVGGSFNIVDGNTIGGIVRLNIDGSIDSTFNVGTGVDYTVYDIAIQDDGKVIIAGDFLTFNGSSHSALIRLNIDGSVDSTYNKGTGPNDWLEGMDIQPDGKILIGGYFTSYNGTSISNIARINTDGTIDSSFTPSVLVIDDSPVGFGFQDDGKIVISGYFTDALVRLNSDGSQDGTFSIGTGISGWIYDVQIQNDGKILVSGSLTSYNGTSIGRFARLNPDGSLDSSFGTGANNWLNPITFYGEGKVILSGPTQFNSFDGSPVNRLIILNLGSYQISNLGGNLQAKSTSSLDVEVGDDFGLLGSDSTVRIYDNGSSSFLADIQADMTVDRNWSGVTGDTDLIGGKSFTHNLTSAPGTAASFTLYVPYVSGHGQVTICPGASSLAALIPGCAGEVTKTIADGDTSIVNIGGQDYWAITGMTGTGGFGSGLENIVYIDLDAQPATAPSTISTAPEVAISTADEFYISYIPTTSEFGIGDYIDVVIPFDWTGLATCGTSTTDADGDAGGDGSMATVDTQIIRYTFSAVTTTALTTGVEVCFAATTVGTPGNYNIALSDTNDGDYGPALIYVGDDNDVTLTATIPITLSLRIKEPATTADTNLCALGVLNPGSVNSCSYRIAAGTNISTGLQVFTFADNQLNTAGDSADIDDTAGGATVTAGVEEHGILVTLGTGWTVGGSFSSTTDEVMPLTETLILDAAASISDSVEANWSTVVHSASVNAGTSGGSYDQLVTYRAWVDT